MSHPSHPSHPPHPATTAQNTLIPFSALIIGASCIGLSPIFVRLVDLGPLALGFYRMFLCLPILLSLNLILPTKPVGPSVKNKKKLIGSLLATGFFTGDLFFWHASIDNTSVANATLLANTAVLFVAIGGWILFNQRITHRFIVGMLCAFAGIVMIGSDSVGLGLGTLYGDALGLGAAVCYSGYLLSINWMRDCLSTRQLMLLINIGCSIFLLLLMLVFENSWLPYSLYSFVVLLALAWVSQFVGQGLIAYGMGYLPAALSAVTLLMQPLVASSVAWFVFDEVLSGLQILGGVAVLIGVIVCKQAPGLPRDSKAARV